MVSRAANRSAIGQQEMMHTLEQSHRPSRMLGSEPSQLWDCQGEHDQLSPQQHHTFY